MLLAQWRPVGYAIRHYKLSTQYHRNRTMTRRSRNPGFPCLSQSVLNIKHFWRVYHCLFVTIGKLEEPVLISIFMSFSKSSANYVKAWSLSLLAYFSISISHHERALALTVLPTNQTKPHLTTVWTKLFPHVGNISIPSLLSDITSIHWTLRSRTRVFSRVASYLSQVKSQHG